MICRECRSVLDHRCCRRAGDKIVLDPETMSLVRRAFFDCEHVYLIGEADALSEVTRAAAKRIRARFPSAAPGFYLGNVVGGGPVNLVLLGTA